MAASPPFDLAAAHRYFSADCFNRAWTLIDKPDRQPEEREQMLLLSQASLWHWSQRDDVQSLHLSIGYWQVSRVHSLLGHFEAAYSAGQRSLLYAEGAATFYVAYAHEALARAARGLGDQTLCKKHVDVANELAIQVADDDERNALLADLKSILA